ncbi:MAG: HAD-IB family phosphatase [Candidatus Dojkabacteria bacterium]|nr:MAG: HAD-IB family phosphatase [Candidatus Dojkabacteria bacterium]
MKIAVLDFDYTLFEGYARYELGYLMEEEGIINHGFSDEVKALQTAYEDGQITYNQKFADDKAIFANYFNGIRRADVTKFLHDHFDWDKYFYPHSSKLITTLKEHGYLTVIVSGCWDFILEEAQEMLDFDTFFCSAFKEKEGMLTNEFATILDYQSKREFSGQILAEATHSIGLGDSVADFEFLNLVNHPFLFEPRSDAIEASKGKNYIVVNRGDALEKIGAVLQ